MRIRNKLIIYFGILLFISFAIAAILSGGLIRFTLNRLLYSNVYELNKNIVISLESLSNQELMDRLDVVKSITGAELIVKNDAVTIFTTFSIEAPDLDTAVLVSSKYDVYRVRFDDTFFFYTQAFLDEGNYQVYVFRSETLALTSSDEIFYTSFIGLIFLAFSVSILSFLTSRVFSNPIMELVAYADQLKPDAIPSARPKFTILEYDELAGSLEKASKRLYQYHLNEQEFLHNFSHEMKTPLTNIYGYAEGIQYGVLSSEDINKACFVIMNESLKLKDNIEQILMLGRLDSVNQTYQMQKVNLANLLGDVLNSVQMQAKEANVTLIYPEIDDSISVIGDPEKLETAFVNIVANGVRYAKTFVRIKVNVVVSRVEVTIDDDGIGIPETERSKVFDRYYIGHLGHTGLGLTITKTILDRHQIDVSIDSNEEGGARFIVLFPGVIRQNRPK